MKFKWLGIITLLCFLPWFYVGETNAAKTVNENEINGYSTPGLTGTKQLGATSPLWIRSGIPGIIFTVAFHPDGKSIVSGGRIQSSNNGI
jgi:hypothetical protein